MFLRTQKTMILTDLFFSSLHLFIFETGVMQSRLATLTAQQRMPWNFVPPPSISWGQDSRRHDAMLGLRTAGQNPGALCVLGRHAATELHPQLFKNTTLSIKKRELYDDTLVHLHLYWQWNLCYYYCTRCTCGCEHQDTHEGRGHGCGLSFHLHMGLRIKLRLSGLRSGVLPLSHLVSPN